VRNYDEASHEDLTSVVPSDALIRPTEINLGLEKSGQAEASAKKNHSKPLRNRLRNGQFLSSRHFKRQPVSEVEVHRPVSSSAGERVDDRGDAVRAVPQLV